jgi:hypothetical protein
MKEFIDGFEDCLRAFRSWRNLISLGHRPNMSKLSNGYYFWYLLLPSYQVTSEELPDYLSALPKDATDKIWEVFSRFDNGFYTRVGNLTYYQMVRGYLIHNDHRMVMPMSWPVRRVYYKNGWTAFIEEEYCYKLIVGVEDAPRKVLVKTIYKDL